jgi:predicted chitinase
MVNPFIASSKDYIKKATLNTKKHHIKITSTLHREKVAILYMRKNFNYSVNELAQFFSRSASLIHRTLKFNSSIGAIQYLNQRKLPNHTRLQSAQKHRLTMQRFMDLWAGFILGETDKPP